jgi:hypothetical protein
MMRQHRHGRGIRDIVSGVDEAAPHGPQAHYVEERAADHSRANDTRLADTNHREGGGREVAERGHGLHACAQIDELRHRERGILDTDPGRALADVDQPRFVPIDERPKEHAPDDAEHCRVGADAQREVTITVSASPLARLNDRNANFKSATKLIGLLDR